MCVCDYSAWLSCDAKRKSPADFAWIYTKPCVRGHMYIFFVLKENISRGCVNVNIHIAAERGARGQSAFLSHCAFAYSEFRHVIFTVKFERGRGRQEGTEECEMRKHYKNHSYAINVTLTKDNIGYCMTLDFRINFRRSQELLLQVDAFKEVIPIERPWQCGGILKYACARARWNIQLSEVKNSFGNLTQNGNVTFCGLTFLSPRRGYSRKFEKLKRTRKHRMLLVSWVQHEIKGRERNSRQWSKKYAATRFAARGKKKLHVKEKQHIANFFLGFGAIVIAIFANRAPRPRKFKPADGRLNEFHIDIDDLTCFSRNGWWKRNRKKIW